MMKICHVVGNRPQFVKLAPLLRALRKHRNVRSVVIHSGQHYDFAMSQVFFEQLGLPTPAYNLGVGSGTNGVQTGKILQRLDPVLLKQRPDRVIVYGDTNTTLAGALAAYGKGISLAHVEAGLREFVWRPEEINRKCADHCSTYAFCPTKTAVKNLRLENVPTGRIFLTGDITYDSFLWAVRKLTIRGARVGGLQRDAPYIVLTMHRAETVDHPRVLASIVTALQGLPIPVVFPVHPRTLLRLREQGLLDRLGPKTNIRLLPALGYFEFLKLLLGARLVLTDSGGVIKEAFYARKPCVTIDDTTEYLEIRNSGANLWSGKHRKDIVAAVDQMLSHDVRRIRPELVFGDGRAAERMAAIMTH